MPHTFSYRHSDLPPARSEIKAEIVALDVQIADLILKSQGNYRELEELAEVLDNCLDSCELNLNSIRIIADDTPSGDPIKEPCSLKDLPTDQKQIIYSCLRTNSVLLDFLSQLTNRPAEDMAQEIADRIQVYTKRVTTAEVEDSINELIEASQSDADHFFKRM